MAFYKKRNYSRRFSGTKRPAYAGKPRYGKKRMYGRKFGPSAVTTKIVESVIRRNVELKQHFFNSALSYPVGGAWDSQVISFVPQGQTNITRTGDRLRMKSLTFTLSMSEPALAVTSATSGFVRFIIGQWFPLISSAPSAGDVLDNLVEYDSPYAMDTRSQYKILWDKTIPIAALNELSRNVYHQTLYFNDQHANVQCTSASVNGTNHLFIMSTASHAGGSNTVVGRFQGTLRFTDS